LRGTHFSLIAGHISDLQRPAGTPAAARTGSGHLGTESGYETPAQDLIHAAAIEERPHDGAGTGKGWSLKTLEHDAHNFPHAIEATDAQGRSATMFL
jgi:hypothetical protein